MESLIETFKIRHEDLTPQEFLKLSKKDRASIVSTRIIPPQLGKKGFGVIRIRLRNATYKPVFSNA